MASRSFHPLRLVRRLLWILAEVTLAAIRYPAQCAFQPRPARATARAVWLSHSCRRVLRPIGLRTRVSGRVPRGGFVVANHLSYLDILLLASLTPCIFVAKHEMKRWPLLGWFARRAGTLFVQRDKRSQTAHAVRQIETALQPGVVIVLFPEGTSSSGDTVLPFKSALLEPVVRHQPTLTLAFIQYDLPDGDVREEVCYWRDMTLLPHLLNLLHKHHLEATVRFNDFHEHPNNRKELARQLHQWFLDLTANPAPLLREPPATQTG
jgi:lyso-ornithine lipid O-acyltransferase